MPIACRLHIRGAPENPHPDTPEPARLTEAAKRNPTGHYSRVVGGGSFGHIVAHMSVQTAIIKHPTPYRHK